MPKCPESSCREEGVFAELYRTGEVEITVRPSRCWASQATVNLPERGQTPSDPFRSITGLGGNKGKKTYLNKGRKMEKETRFFAAESVRISPGIRALQPLITFLALPQSWVRQKSCFLSLLASLVCLGTHLQSEVHSNTAKPIARHAVDE